MLKGYESYTLLPDIDVQLLEDQIYFLPYQAIRIFLEKGEAALV